MRDDMLARLTPKRRGNRTAEALAEQQAVAAVKDANGLRAVPEEKPEPEPEPKPVELPMRYRDTSLRRSLPGVRMVFYLPMEVEQALREQSALERSSMSLLATEAITTYLANAKRS